MAYRTTAVIVVEVAAMAAIPIFQQEIVVWAVIAEMSANTLVAMVEREDESIVVVVVATVALVQNLFAVVHLVSET